MITLLYLAKEIRRNAQAIDATTTRDVGLPLSEWNRDVAKNPELKRISLKRVASEMQDFTAEEWHEFRVFPMSLDIGSREESEHYMRMARGLIDRTPEP